MNSRYRVFIDFDGTITANDVGYEMFKHFTRGATEPLVQSYRDGKINSFECLSRECEIWNRRAPLAEHVYAYLDSQPLSPGLGEFLRILDGHGIKPTILSEGFDFYIDRVLTSRDLSHFERITNRASFRNGRLSPEFPYNGLGCKECSNCKGYHIAAIRPPKASAVYIGDGHSDLHASVAADIVFAKSHLKSLLEKEGRHFVEYQDFHDVVPEFETVSGRGIFARSARLDLCWTSEKHYRSLMTLWESGDVMRFVGYPDGLRWNKERYRDHFRKLADGHKAVHLAIEDKAGVFMGEAKIAFPDANGFCQHDVKLLPEFQAKGLGYETWQVILDRAGSRWPGARALVTPSVENVKAIDMYRRLGFVFDGGLSIWEPPETDTAAVSVTCRRMIKS